MRALLFAALLLSGTVEADELILMLRSHHNDPQHNNSTPGLIYANDGWYMGAWHNSNSKATLSAGLMLDIAKDTGIAVGLTTGYRRPVNVMAYKRWEHVYLFAGPGVVAVAWRIDL